MKRFSIEIPMRTYSESNERVHWVKRYQRTKAQKHTIWAMLHNHKAPSLPCMLKVTRIAPRSLDMDNLGGCLKSVVDAASEWITPNLAAGRADSVQGLKIELGQEKGKVGYYAIRIDVEDP